MESLRTVRDIWKQEGQIDEIHIELGRNLKQNAEQRKKTQQRQQENEKANLRAKLLLQEFMNPELKIDGILITMFNPRTVIGRHQQEQLKKIAEVMKTKVYKTVIRRCNTISVSQSERKSIFNYPSSNAALDYENFLEEFLNG